MNRIGRRPSAIAIALIFLTAPLLVSNTAAAQGAAARAESEPPTLEESAAGDTQIAPATAGRAGPDRKPFLTALSFVPLATHVAAAGALPSGMLYPADRFAIAQIVGGGYVVNPRFRFGAVGIFNEVLTGLPTGASTWQVGAFAPIAIGTLNHFFVGGGPVFAYRSGGRWQSDFGAVMLTGASIPVRKGLAVNLMAPVTALVSRRSTISVGVAAGIAKVF